MTLQDRYGWLYNSSQKPSPILLPLAERLLMPNGSILLCKPTVEALANPFTTYGPFLQLRMTLRPCSSICEYPHEPAGQSTTPFRHLRIPLRACRIQNKQLSLWSHFTDALQTLYRRFTDAFIALPAVSRPLPVDLDLASRPGP